MQANNAQRSFQTGVIRMKTSTRILPEKCRLLEKKV